MEMKIQSAPLTIIDQTDSRKLEVYITSNMPTIQIRNSNSGAYTPDWTKEGLQLTAQVFLESRELTENYNSNYSVEWYKDNTIVATNAADLNVGENVLNGNTAFVTYTFKVIYQGIEALSRITFARVDTGEDGSDGTSVRILGTAKSVSDVAGTNYHTIEYDEGVVVAAALGDAYVYGGELYVCSVLNGGQDGKTDYFVKVGPIQGEPGQPAKSIVLTGSSQVFKIAKDGKISPSTVTVTAHTVNLTTEQAKNIKWEYRYNASGTWNNIANGASTSGGDISRKDNVITINGNKLNQIVIDDEPVMSVVLRAAFEDAEDVLTIYKTFDGEKGDTASMAFLTNENISFSANANGEVITGVPPITINVVAYNGSEKVMPEIGTITDIPDGMTITVDKTSLASLSKEIVLILSVGEKKNFGSPSSNYGVITVPVISPVSTTLKLSWSKINAGPEGEAGVGIDRIDVEYGESDSSSTRPTDWVKDIPSVAEGDYLWTRTIIHYTDPARQDTVTYTYSKQGTKGDTGTSVEDVEIEYVAHMNGTTPPATGWSSVVVATTVDKPFLWTKTTFLYGAEKSAPVYSVARYGTDGAKGDPAKSIVLSANSQIFKVDKTNAITPSAITVVAQTSNTSITNWSYSVNGGQSFVNTAPNGVVRNGNTITVTGSTLAADSLVIKASDGTISDVFTIYKTYDGTNGTPGNPGAPAPIAFLTNENVTFSANSQGQIASTTITSNVVAYNGTTKVLPTVGTITGMPTGMTVTQSTITEKNEIGLTIAIANNSTLGSAANNMGTISIPITSPVNTVLSLTWSKVNTGATGNAGRGITKITEYYLATSASSGVTRTTSGWKDTIQTVTDTNKYLWNYEMISYTDGTTAPTDPIIIGVYGDKGDTGNGIASIEEWYLATSASSGITTATSGWKNTMQSLTATNKYLWNYELVTYTNGDKVPTTPVIIGVYGDKGNSGDDAYTVLLTNESHVFAGTVSAAIASTATTQALAYKRAVAQTVTIVSVNGVAATTTSTATGITGLSFACSALSGASPTITFTCTTAFVSPSGTIPIVLSVGGISITKMFAYSIAFKGATGGTGAPSSSYWLVSNASAVQKTSSGDILFTPATLTFTGRIQTGTTAPTNYAGRWILAYSTDGTTYTDSYTSTANEATASIAASDTYKAVRARMYLAGGTTTLLDEQIIPFVSDGETGGLGAPGDPGVTFQVYSNNGYALSANIPTILLQTFAYFGDVEITSGATFQWYRHNGTDWVAVSGATNAYFNVSRDDVSFSNNYMCKMQFNSTEYVGVVTIDDKNDENKVFASKPSNYFAGDLWIVGTDYAPSGYAVGTMLRAEHTNSAYTDSDWVPATKYDDEIAELKATVDSYKQYFSVNSSSGLQIGNSSINNDVLTTDRVDSTTVNANVANVDALNVTGSYSGATMLQAPVINLGKFSLVIESNGSLSIVANT